MMDLEVQVLRSSDTPSETVLTPRITESTGMVQEGLHEPEGAQLGRGRSEIQRVPFNTENVDGVEVKRRMRIVGESQAI